MEKIFITAPYLHRDRTWVEEHVLSKYNYDFQWIPVEERLSAKELSEFIGLADGIICGDDDFSHDVLTLCDRLRVIVKWGTGIDSIDLEAATARGIKVRRTPGAFTIPVAETTLALILNHYRNISVNQAVFRGGEWDKPTGECIEGKTAGLIGFGDIGKQVAILLRAFKVNVRVYDTRVVSDTELDLASATFCDLDELYATSDIISLHCDLNKGSECLISAKALSKMIKIPYLINTARGGLMDYDALLNALNSGKLAGCGLDVFDNEPLHADHPLRRHHLVTASCHNSNSSPRHWRKIHVNSFQMLADELDCD